MCHLKARGIYSRNLFVICLSFVLPVGPLGLLPSLGSSQVWQSILFRARNGLTSTRKHGTFRMSEGSATFPSLESWAITGWPALFFSINAGVNVCTDPSGSHRGCIHDSIGSQYKNPAGPNGLAGFLARCKGFAGIPFRLRETRKEINVFASVRTGSCTCPRHVRT